MARNAAALRRAHAQVARFAEEIVRAQAALGLTDRNVARLARVSPGTVCRIRLGSATVRVDTLCAVAASLGLDLAIRAFIGREPGLRDTCQLRVAEALCEIAHTSWRPELEVAAGEHGRSADVVLFGPTEMIHAEIERLLVDFQLQLRSGKRKREALAAQHSRPVRLVLVVQDTHRNRRVAVEHAGLLGRELPAGSREILRALRTGRPLGRDGLLWVRAGARTQAHARTGAPGRA